MNFQVDDIVVSAPGVKSGVWVITGIDPSRPKNQYNATSLVNGKCYRLSDSYLAVKRVGVADKNSVSSGAGNGQPSNNAPADRNVLNGQLRVQREVARLQFPGNGTSDDLKRWEILANAKFGDQIDARVRGKETKLTFRYVTDRGYKFVFVADNENGTRYKYPLAVIRI
jgi:hypothetical protein